jgi:EmrB/QacA subfamily drug resistance transporter
MAQQKTNLTEVTSSASAGAVQQQLDDEKQVSKWTVLAIVGVGVFMATLDSSIVNISLPVIAHEFHVGLNGAVEWVIIAYLVMTAGILLSAGRLADMIGRKAVWIMGLIIFTSGSALCGAAPSLALLIAFRALQGIGGSLLFASSPAMLTRAFPPEERGRALGLNAVIVSLGVSVGPTLGGFLTTISWRLIFYVNVPIGIVGIIATWLLLKERLQRNAGKFDPWGAILLAIGLITITAAISFGEELGWTSLPIVGAIIVGLIALCILPFVEKRAANPVLDLSLFNNRVFVSANLSLVLSFLALFAVSFMMPFYLEQLKQYPTAEVGLLLTPLPVTIAFIAPFSGALADRIGTRWLAAGGLAIACIGLALLSQLNANSSLFDIIWRLVFTGVGQAIFQSPNNSALMGSAPRNRQGSASGFLATGRVIGQSLSVALAGTIFAALRGAFAGNALVTHQYTTTVQALQNTFAHAFQITFLVCAAIAFIGVFTSLVRGKEALK